MSTTHTPTPWKVGHWGCQCHHPKHVAERRHPGPPECVYEPYFTHGYGGIAGPETNQMVVDREYDELTLSAPDAERIVSCVNACAGIANPETTIPALVAALKGLVEMYGPSTLYGHEAQEAWQYAEAALALVNGEPTR